MQNQNILVVGAGPIGLLTAWTISKSKNTSVEIYTESKEISSHYSVAINNKLCERDSWIPQFIDMPSKLNRYNMIFICKPFTIVDKYLLKNVELGEYNRCQIIVLASFAAGIKTTKYYKHVYFAWPNVSVEIDKNKINATTALELHILTNKGKTKTERMGENLNRFGIKTIYIANPQYFYIIAMITYASYTALIDKKTSYTQKKDLWIKIMAQSIAKQGLTVGMVEKQYLGASIVEFAVEVFEILYHCYMDTNYHSMAENLKILLKKRDRMENYIKDYEEQTKHNGAG